MKNESLKSQTSQQDLPGNTIIDYTKAVGALKAETGVKISCVIPAYNEEKTIADVLKLAINYPYFDEIIVVNDGSSDKTYEIAHAIEESNPKVKVLSNNPNLGKTGAVIKAVHAANFQLIVMIDADLVAVTHNHLSKLIYYVLSGQYSMTILDRASDRESPIGWFHSVAARLFGGERALWKSDFLKIKFEGNERYGLEAIMNLYYANNGQKVRSIFAPDLYSLYQFHKRGFFKGIIVYAKMWYQMLRQMGARRMLKMVTTVEEDRLEKLYSLRNESKFKTPFTLAILTAGLLLSIQTFAYLRARRIKRQVQSIIPS